MAGAQAFSHSRLSTLDECPRRYGWRYVERRREDFDTVEAFRGQVVHAALAWLYLEREARRSPSADDLVRRYREEWDARRSPRVRVIRDAPDPAGLGQEEAWRAEAEAWLRKHHEETFAKDRRTTLAAEPRVEMDVAGTPFVGYVDRLAEGRDGTLHVIDYKTSRRVPADFGAVALQVQGYGVAVMETRGHAGVSLEYDYLQAGAQFRGRLTREEAPEVRATLARRVEAARAAEREGAFPPRPGSLCAWCGFRESCDVSGFAPALAESGATAEARCPRCRKPLRKRSGKHGEFMGCTGFPACRYARDVGPPDRPRSGGEGGSLV